MPQQAKATFSPSQIYLHLGCGPSASSLVENLGIRSTQSISTAQIVSSTVDGGYRGGSGLRILGQSDLDDDFLYGKKKDEVESVLSKIDKIIELAGVDLDMGSDSVGSACWSCLGLVDPVTNIRFNHLLAAVWLVLPRGADEDTMAGGARGADEDTMAGGIQWADEDTMDGGNEDTMAHRTLDGLIAFLTCLFPYLPDAEAVRYIDAAGADPLVAALLVIYRRGLTVDSFITTASVEIALRSAAVATKHPDPELFIRRWKMASLFPEKLATCFTGGVEKIAHFLFHLRGLSADDPQLEDEYLWKLAQQRLLHMTQIRLGRLPSVRGAMKRMLLSVIHGYYLKALAALPKQDLTEHHHQSLLISGHCYGPLDPVSNIIINTIWYEHSFPAATKVQPLKMISTDCLWRIASRSLYGLVSFLCNRNKRLTPDQALHELLVAQANLSVAEPALSDHYGKKARRHRGATVHEAYIAAALSAKHPRPNSQADFLGQQKSVDHLRGVSERLLPKAWDDCTLDKEVLNCLIMLLRCPSSAGMPYSQQMELEPIQLRHEVYLQFCSDKNSFWLKDERVGRMVDAALRNFNESRVPKYSLHVICGVNEFVKREFDLDTVKPYNRCTPYKYHYSHINFLATCEGSPAPKLFFAECSNHGTDTWCVPVPLHPDGGILLGSRPVGMRPEAVRCIYCEHEMGRIVHPITEKFCGRDDFEKLDGDVYSNDNLVSSKGYRVDCVENVADEVIYSNYCDSGRRGPIRSDDGTSSWL